MIAYERDCFNLAAQCLDGANEGLSKLDFNADEADDEFKYLIDMGIIEENPQENKFGELMWQKE